MHPAAPTGLLLGTEAPAMTFSFLARCPVHCARDACTLKLAILLSHPFCGSKCLDVNYLQQGSV